MSKCLKTLAVNKPEVGGGDLFTDKNEEIA
jgi:hypothetical protein